MKWKWEVYIFIQIVPLPHKLCLLNLRSDIRSQQHCYAFINRPGSINIDGDVLVVRAGTDQQMVETQMKNDVTTALRGLIESGSSDGYTFSGTYLRVSDPILGNISEILPC